MFHVLPFADLKFVTVCKYSICNLHGVLLHKTIPGSSISYCLGSVVDVNLAFLDVEMRFGGFGKAKIGLVSLNFRSVSGSLINLGKFATIF